MEWRVLDISSVLLTFTSVRILNKDTVSFALYHHGLVVEVILVVIISVCVSVMTFGGMVVGPRTKSGKRRRRRRRRGKCGGREVNFSTCACAEQYRPGASI